MEAFRWCNHSPGPQAQSCRCHINCGIHSSQAIEFERAFSPARSEHVLTPGNSRRTAQTLCSDPLHRSSPWHPAPTWRGMLTPSQRNATLGQDCGGCHRVLLLTWHGEGTAHSVPQGRRSEGNANPPSYLWFAWAWLVQWRCYLAWSYSKPAAIQVTILYWQPLLAILASSWGRRSEPLKGNARSRGISGLLM